MTTHSDLNEDATSATLDLIQDAAMIADTLGLRAKYRRVPKYHQGELSGDIPQLTVYGARYDGTDRSGRLSKATDKIRISAGWQLTPDGTSRHGYTILGLTGNNARTWSQFVARDEDREEASEILADRLGILV